MQHWKYNEKTQTKTVKASDAHGLRNIILKRIIKYEKKWILLGDFSFLDFLRNDLQERNGKLRNRLSKRKKKKTEEKKMKNMKKRLLVSPWYLNSREKNREKSVLTYKKFECRMWREGMKAKEWYL